VKRGGKAARAGAARALVELYRRTIALTHFVRRCVIGAVQLLLVTHRLLTPPRFIATALCCGMSASVLSGAAAVEQKRSYNLPSGDAATTLNQFAGVSSRQIIFMMDKVRGERTNAIAGDYAAHEALDRMLAGTALSASRDPGTGAFVVTRKAPKGEVGPVSDPQPKPKTTQMNRKNPVVVLAAWLAAAVSHLTAQQPATTPPPADETVTLPAFSVSSDRANGYRATDSMSAARIRTPIVDTSATVNVITGDFLKDIGAASLFDATQYVSGIGNGRLSGGSGILDRQTIRGYENDGRTIDNFSSSFQANLSPLLYERVEIVKGPNAILAPTGTPGGSINVITKAPSFTQSNVAQLEVGRYFTNQLSVDSTGPIADSKNAAYRVIFGYQDARSSVPGSIRQWSFNPQFTYKISPRSQLTLKLNYVQWGTYGGAQNPSITLHASDALANGATISTDTIATGFSYGANNGSSATWSARTDRVERGTLEFTHALTDRINLRVAGLRHYDHFWTDFTGLATPGQSNQGSRYEPSTGIYTPNLVWSRNAAGAYVSTPSPQFDPTSVPRTAGAQASFINDTQLQSDLAGNFSFPGLTFQPLVGASYQRNTNRNKNWTAVAGQLPNLNLFAPVETPAHPTAYNVTGFTDTVTTKKQAYAFGRFGLLGDRLFLSGGIARLHVDVPVTNLVTGLQTSRLDGSTNTPLYGALFKATKEVSLYYSHSTNANGVLFNSAALFQEGKQDEFGVKGEFFNQRLLVTASRFKIRQNNIVTPNPSFFIDPINNPQNFKADLSNTGYEFDIVGGITKELSILGSYTDMKLRDAFGRRRRNIPDTTLNAMLKYDVREGAAKNLGLFAGFTHVGDQAGEDPATTATPLGVVTKISFFVPARTIANIGASYKVGKYRLNLNVDNVFDKKTIWQPSGRFSLAPYPGINYRFSTTLTF
jgi:iron complex outermembrane receptor protein